ncbi:hypothetical protein KP696_02885 [Nocardia seriolae]|uniref:Uncharacterized protein n=1 Tax=Nocardia seriolae TaxID=37332 RepID=A0ABC9YQG9_9NOCA|nr:hypothetical protein [Nocardia seriolae]GEM23369.1 hypothetical protein NS2_16080 [Nocardia seriolae NBRC 15557]OJF79437.1 hypothetical protein NS14008_09780 [Nocardia seriolae]WNJ57133.1 hypothetical protein RMO66_27365 [Nocardia seriolae]BEK86718.1 hypothetical protein NSERKGN1266_26690 [Nocardia seriolae]BEK94473.1 hypothetical protein NSER024013_23790 [Nocardia seriolae]
MFRAAQNPSAPVPGPPCPANSTPRLPAGSLAAIREIVISIRRPSGIAYSIGTDRLAHSAPAAFASCGHDPHRNPPPGSAAAIGASTLAATPQAAIAASLAQRLERTPPIAAPPRGRPEFAHPIRSQSPCPKR